LRIKGLISKESSLGHYGKASQAKKRGLASGLRIKIPCKTHLFDEEKHERRDYLLR
jgi:hypothetical protein